MTFNQLNEHRGKAYWTPAKQKAGSSTRSSGFCVLSLAEAGSFSPADSWIRIWKELSLARCITSLAAHHAAKQFVKHHGSLPRPLSFLKPCSSSRVIPMKVIVVCSPSPTSTRKSAAELQLYPQIHKAEVVLALQYPCCFFITTILAPELLLPVQHAYHHAHCLLSQPQ